jgi:hypothetical protein
MPIFRNRFFLFLTPEKINQNEKNSLCYPDPCISFDFCAFVANISSRAGFYQMDLGLPGA